MRIENGQRRQPPPGHADGLSCWATPLRAGGLPRSRCSSRPHRVLPPKAFSEDQTQRVTRSQQRSCVVDVGDYTQVSLKGLVISMASSNARKRAARDHQRRFPGTPYPVALRAVSHADSSLRVVIGADAAGRPCWADIEELAGGGDGPHVAVIGASRFGRCRAIELMVESMAARPPRRGVEVLTTQGEVGQVNHLIEERTRTLSQAGARDFAELRTPRTGEQRDLGQTVPAVVVVVDIDDQLIDGFPPVLTREGYVARTESEETVSMLNRLLRQGRSLDLHTVLMSVLIESGAHLLV